MIFLPIEIIKLNSCLFFKSKKAMRKIITTIFFTVISLSLSNAAQIKVVVPDGTPECYIAGTFNGWSHQKMEKVGDNQFILEVTGLENSEIQYKFTSGPGWIYEELDSDMQNIDNRIYDEYEDVVLSWRKLYAGDRGLLFTALVPEGSINCYLSTSIDTLQFAKMMKTASGYQYVIKDGVPDNLTYNYYDQPERDRFELNENGSKHSPRTYAAEDVINSWRSRDLLNTYFQVVVPQNTKECYIAGNFNSWSHVPITRVDSTFYTYSLTGYHPSEVQYKYSSGPGWEFVEKGSTGDEIPNRNHSNLDIVASWVQTYNPDQKLIFTVQVPEGTEHCYIAGSFNNWRPQPMEKGDSSLFRLTIKDLYDLNIQYKYLCGPEWHFNEVRADQSIRIDRIYTPRDHVEAWQMIYTPGAETKFDVTVPSETFTCYIVSDYQFGTFNEMTRIAPDRYTFTYKDIAPSDISGYKYFSGPDVVFIEDGLHPKDKNKRVYSSADVVDKWTIPYDPEASTSFSVNVPDESMECYIAGDFNNWTPTKMTQAGESKIQWRSKTNAANRFFLTIPNISSKYVGEYMYLSGPDMNFSESNPSGEEPVVRKYNENSEDIVSGWDVTYNPESKAHVSLTIHVPSAFSDACLFIKPLQSGLLPISKIESNKYSVILTDVTQQTFTICYEGENGFEIDEYGDPVIRTAYADLPEQEIHIHSFYVEPTSVDKNSFYNSWKIYANNQEIYIKPSGSFTGASQLEVYNSVGQLIFKKEINDDAIIPVRHKGIYIYRLYNNESKKNGKLIVN